MTGGQWPWGLHPASRGAHVHVTIAERVLEHPGLCWLPVRPPDLML